MLNLWVDLLKFLYIKRSRKVVEQFRFPAVLTDKNLIYVALSIDIVMYSINNFSDTVEIQYEKHSPKVTA
jgi:hypothetical protein